MLTKQTPSAIKAMYDDCMAAFATTHLTGIFPDSITVVFDRLPETDNHDVWFYCYKQGPDRIATITAAGTQMTVDTESTIERIQNVLKPLSDYIAHERNRLCEMETGVPYAVATGQTELPATAHRKPTRERRH